MTETPRGIDRWVSLATSFVAPVTVISGVLFYFGYVAARAQYDYFGLDVDVIGLSTRAYVMRSPQPLLTPMLVLTLGGVAVVAFHHWVRRHATESWFGRVVRAVLGTGLVLLAAGTLLLAGFSVVGGWAYYSLVTPVLLGGGAALVAYALRLRGRSSRASFCSGWASPPVWSGRRPRPRSGPAAAWRWSRPAACAACPASSSTPASGSTSRPRRESRRPYALMPVRTATATVTGG